MSLIGFYIWAISMIKKILNFLRKIPFLVEIKSSIQIYYTYFTRSLINKIIYGSNSPKFRQTIHINPSLITEICECSYDRMQSGKVITTDVHFLSLKKIEHNWKYMYLYDRYVKGVDSSLLVAESDWDYLDNLFLNIKERGLLSTKERNPRVCVHSDGIIVHIDKDSNLIFGGGGNHRLFISKILKLSLIPVEVGYVHVQALKTGRFNFK